MGRQENRKFDKGKARVLRQYLRIARPRGSLLIFAVVVLSVLAMVGTAYLVTVEQSRRAASNYVNTTQADLTVQSGLIHAENSIRTMVAEGSTVTLEGVYDPLQPSYQFLNNIPTVTQVPPLQSIPYLHSAYRDFDPDLNGDATDTSGDVAILFWDKQQIYNQSVKLGATELCFSSTPLATTTYPSGQPRANAANTLTHDGWSHRVQLIDKIYDTAYLNTYLNDFYFANLTPAVTNTAIKEMPRVSNLRGEYYVWISDMDAKLYAIPADWGIDTSYIAPPAGFPDNATWENTIRHNILSQSSLVPAPLKLMGINDFGSTSSISPATGWGGTTTQYFGMQLIDNPTFPNDDIGTILNLPKTPLGAISQFRSIGEFALNLPSLNLGASVYTMPPNYSATRAALDYYFTVYQDVPDPAFPLLGSVKNQPAAININTATPEVIAAALGGIPVNNAGLTLGTDTDTNYPGLPRSWILALRIVAQRPFLCRLDFEDFLAALLPGDMSPPVITFTTDLGAINYAIGKRTDKELTLSQFLEIQGLDENQLLLSNPNHPYLNANTVAAMQKRFNFFANPPSLPLPLLPKPLLKNVTEFNNIANSLFTLPAHNNIQVNRPGNAGVIGIVSSASDTMLEITQPVGTDVVAWIIVPGPGSPGLQSTLAAGDINVVGKGNEFLLYTSFIIPGPDNILHSTPTGTDVKLQAILASTNGISGDASYNSTVRTGLFGYSYYSHDYTAQNYKPNGYTVPPATPVVNPNAVLPAFAGKFVYGDPKLFMVPADVTGGSATPNVNYVKPSDLQLWSCIGDGQRSGYYDMFFNFNDIMVMELGKKDVGSPGPPPVAPTGTDVIIKTLNAAPLQSSAVNDTDDRQELQPGAASAPGNLLVISPGPDNKLQTTALPPDRVVPAICVLLSSTTVTNLSGNDQLEHSSDPKVDYIIGDPTGSGSLATAANQAEGDVLTSVIIVGTAGSKAVTQVINDDVLDAANNQIQVGENLIPETSVWGPIRASQRSRDMALPININQLPAAQVTSGRLQNGDVSWSPQFAFRSRFFGIYVLGRGLMGGYDPNNSAALKVTGERRIEAVYDALKDQIIWQRTQVSDKHALGDP